MQPTDFCYFLQGFSEIHGKRPTEKQWLIIQDHLKLVFNKVTPDRSAPIVKVPFPIYDARALYPANPVDGVPSGFDFAKVTSITC